MIKTLNASFLTLGLIAVLGAFAILYATPQGLGLSDDSIAYIAGARSILGGQGYREAWLASNQPVTHFPPGFSTALSIVGISGLDPVRGSRFLNALLFGANAFLLGVLGWRMTKSRIAGIGLALLFVVNASMIRVHSVAMSEPLYIFFSLGAFLLFGLHQVADGSQAQRQIQEPASLPVESRALILAGVISSLAYLTRYAGLALLATFLVAVVLLNENWKTRLIRIGYFLLGFLPLAIAWGIRNKLVADNATNRTLVFHPLTAENIEIGVYNFSEFLVPVEAWRRILVNTPNLFTVVTLIIGASILIWLLFTGLKKFFKPLSLAPEILSFTSGLYIFGYLASIISSMLLFDASTKFRLRINAPVYVSLLILLVWLGFVLWQKKHILLRGLVVLIGALYLSLSIYDTSAVIMQLRKGGVGYASFQWFDSEAMAYLRELPEGTRIYTNQPGPVYLYTNRPCYVLPDLIDPVTGLPREGYEEGVQFLQDDVLAGNAVLALFKFGADDEDVQAIHENLSQGLYLAHSSSGDKVYSAQP